MPLVWPGVVPLVLALVWPGVGAFGLAGSGCLYRVELLGVVHEGLECIDWQLLLRLVHLKTRHRADSGARPPTIIINHS